MPQGMPYCERNPFSLWPILHIPFDPDFYHELNVERRDLSKTGKLLFNHPLGTNNDQSWATALVVCAAEQARLPQSRHIARIICHCVFHLLFKDNTNSRNFSHNIRFKRYKVHLRILRVMHEAEREV